MKILVFLVATLVVVKAYRYGRFQRSPQHRRPFRSYSLHNGASSFKSRRSPPWDSLPPFMKAEMMMNDMPMILESKPAAPLPQDFEIKLPSIIHDLPSLLRKPTIIIGDKIPIFHGSSFIIRDPPPAMMAADAPKAPEPAMMPAAPAPMMPAPEPMMPEPEPMMVPPTPAVAPAAAAAEPPMAMSCSKPPPPSYGPWADQTLSLPPEFFMTDESNHLSGDMNGAGIVWDTPPISPLHPWASMPKMPTMVEITSTEAPATEAPTTTPPPPEPTMAPEMTSPPVEAPTDASPAVPMMPAMMPAMMPPEAMSFMIAPPRATKSNLIFQQSTLPETFNIVSLQHHQISAPFKLALQNAPAAVDMMNMPMMPAMMPEPVTTTAAPVTMAPVETTTVAETPAPVPVEKVHPKLPHIPAGWQLGDLGEIDYGAQQNNPVWKQMVSEPAKWSLIVPQHRRPVPTSLKHGHGWW
ncbi:extensin-like [Leptopilina heterotoma]|uniref:extensin-like n=1 Tax=Leptopilina heterotoma TaxID=63436 RepID=UPI001CA9E793|nr:extensin-like [Leptopilina heterotoma]